MGLRELMARVAKRTLRRKGLFATPLTGRSELVTLIRQLRPMIPDVGLVRLGRLGDGGYLVPDSLSGIKACFSPGVSTESSFELDCAGRGMQVFLADASVEAPMQSHPLFQFSRIHIGAWTYGQYETLESWVSKSGLGDAKDDLILQRDIEEGEYEVILSCDTSLLQRFRVIVLELHSLDQLWNRPFFLLAARAIHKLLTTHMCACASK